MKLLNDFLNTMQRVATYVSSTTSAEEAINIINKHYHILQAKSNQIDEDLDSLLSLGNEDRMNRRHELLDRISLINKLYLKNEDLYKACGYWSSKMESELYKFVDLFYFINRFLQHFQSTFDKDYTMEYLRRSHKESEEYFDKKVIKQDSRGEFIVSDEEQITIQKVIIEDLHKLLKPYFENPEELKSVLYGNIPSEPLVFKGQAAKLLCVFNKLKIQKKIVQKRGLLFDWFIQTFRFKGTGDSEPKVANITTLNSQYKIRLSELPKKGQIQGVEELF